jgi:predicted DNA-binding WGR domain protein
MPDMLNEYVIICSWGSTITRLGNSKKHAFDTQNDAVEFIRSMISRRLRRGYQLKD